MKWICIIQGEIVSAGGFGELFIGTGDKMAEPPTLPDLTKPATRRAR